MAAMVGARRALLVARYSRRGAIAAAAPMFPYRGVDSLPSLGEERDYLWSLLLHRSIGSVASERSDEDDHHGWGANKAGGYRDPYSDHFNQKQQRDLPSAGSPTGVDGNRGVNGACSVGAHYGSNSEQTCGNSYQPYDNTRVNNEIPGYNVRQSYGSNSAYNQKNLGADYPNAHQQYNGMEANNGHSGYGKGRTYHNPNGYDTYNTGYNTQNSQKIYSTEEATTGQYGSGSSRQSFTNSVGSDQQVSKKQIYDNHTSGGSYPERSGNPTSQHTNPTSYHNEHVLGNSSQFGYNASQAYQSPYSSSKADTYNNHQGYPMNLNTGVQHNPHGIYQQKLSHSQHAASFENNLNRTPHQDDTYEVPNEGTIEELEKLCEDGKVKQALDVMDVLQAKGTVLNYPQYIRLMQACGDANALAEARVIHSKISESTLSIDTDVQNKILEMYARCGSMEDAKELFSTMDPRNLTSWNTMISGFVRNGLGEEATDFFDQFKKTGDKPDSTMFKHIFLACGILSSVDEGMLHFESMQKDFGITPTMEHYASVVSMLGQSGYIAEALEFVEQLPMEPSIDVWDSLINMCRLNGFLELGDRCAQIVERLDPSRLNEQSKMGLFPVTASDLAKEKERKKASAAEGRNRVHEYRAGDRSHPETPKIYEELKYLSAHMKEAGYIADTRFVLHDVDHETKEDALLAHSERLAVSYGLITSPVRAPIRVIKNLRSCGDCHTALKIISKLVGRQIVARDAKRFHHFENGVCSCNDYW